MKQKRKLSDKAQQVLNNNSKPPALEGPLSQSASNSLATTGILDRLLTTVKAGNKSYLVFDCKNKEFLCYGTQTSFIPGCRPTVFTPVSFNSQEYATNFIDGKKTIADVQEGLSNLAVLFTDKFLIVV